MELKNIENEKIIGVIDEIQDFSITSLGYRYWVCFVTDRGSLVFVFAYNLTAGDGFSGDGKMRRGFVKADKMRKNYLNHSIKEIINLFPKKHIIKVNEYHKIELKKKPISSDQVIIDTDDKKIKYKVRRKQFNTIKGIVEEGQSFDEALRNSGFDYARIKYWVLIAILFAMTYYSYLELSE